MPPVFNLLIGWVETAHAQSLSDIANAVSNGLLPFFGANGAGGGGALAYVGIAEFVLARIELIVGIFTLLLLVRAGLKLIYGQTEDKFEEAKRGIANGLVAVILIFLVSKTVDAFIRIGGTDDPLSAAAGADILTVELLGLVRWIETVVGIIAVGMIIAAVFQAMISIGSDDATTKIRRAVYGAAAGILLILLDVVFRAMFGLEYFALPGTPSPFPVLLRAAIIVEYLLGFLALVATVIVIYAGIRMIVFIGSEEEFTKAKSLIFRTLIGLFVVLISFIIVRFTIALFLV